MTVQISEKTLWMDESFNKLSRSQGKMNTLEDRNHSQNWCLRKLLEKVNGTQAKTTQARHSCWDSALGTVAEIHNVWVFPAENKLRDRSIRVRYTKKITHIMNARRGRLAMGRQQLWQAEWQPGGRRKCSRSYGRQPALIPVVRYNSRLMFITLPKAIIYTLDVAVENHPFHLPIYSYSYLFIFLSIYNNPDGLF